MNICSICFPFFSAIKSYVKIEDSKRIFLRTMDALDLVLQIKTSIFEWKNIQPLISPLESFIDSNTVSSNNEGNKKCTDFQSSLVKETIDSNIFKEFPPCPFSTGKLIKRLLLILEDSKIEGHSSLYDYISKSDSFETQKCYYKSYFDVEGKHIVSLVERRELICDGTTGLRTWQAGTFLAKWLIDNPWHLSKGKESSILELGSGVGYTGISLFKDTRFSPLHMMLTDHHSAVLDTLYQNVVANLFNQHDKNTELKFPLMFKSNEESRQRTLIIDELDWETFQSKDVICQEFWPDLVIGADIVFDTSVIPHLVNVISRCLSDFGTEKVIMANCVRNEATDAYFMKYLEQSNILFTKETHTLDCGTPLNLYIIRNK